MVRLLHFPPGWACFRRFNTYSSRQLLLCLLVSRSCPSVHSLDGRSSQSHDWQRVSHIGVRCITGRPAYSLWRSLLKWVATGWFSPPKFKLSIWIGWSVPKAPIDGKHMYWGRLGGGGGSPIHLLAEKYRHIHRLGSADKILGWTAGKCVSWSLRFQNFPRPSGSMPLIPKRNRASPLCDSFTVKHCPPNLPEYPSGYAPLTLLLFLSLSLFHTSFSASCRFFMTIDCTVGIIKVDSYLLNPTINKYL